jgi:hypothetical protein
MHASRGGSRQREEKRGLLTEPSERICEAEMLEVVAVDRQACFSV